MSRREEINRPTYFGNASTPGAPPPITEHPSAPATALLTAPTSEESVPRTPFLLKIGQKIIERLRTLTRLQLTISGGAVALLFLTLLVATSAGGSAVSAYCATSAIPTGTELSPQVKPCKVPKRLVPDSSDISAAEIAEARAAGDIAAGEIITRVRFSDPSLPAGWRAVSLHSDTGAAASPGTHAELIISVEGDEGPPQVLCADSIIRQKSATAQAQVLVAMPQQCAHKLAQLPEDYAVSLLLR